MRKLLANIGCRVKVTTFSLEDMEKIIFANDFLIEKIVFYLKIFIYFLFEIIV